MSSEHGPLRTSFTARGLLRYEIEVQHRQLAKYQVIRGDDRDVVMQKAETKMAQWDDMWKRKRKAESNRLERENRAREVADKKLLAAEQTNEATAALKELTTVLSHTLSIDDTVDWESLKNFSDCPTPRPPKPSLPAKPGLAPKPKKPSALDFMPELGVFDRIFQSKRAAKEQQAQMQLAAALAKWKQDNAEAITSYNARVQEYNSKVKELGDTYRQSVVAWERERAEYVETRNHVNAAVDRKKERYMNGDAGAIVDYCDIVLSSSQYPDYFPQSYQLDYNPDNTILIVDYDLPSIDSLPTVREVRYIQSKDEFEEKHISRAELTRNYDDLLYQIALRTIHELYEADAINAIASIVFNGYVNSVDQATGQQTHPCVLSIQANRDEFEGINLASVDPKTCFKKLKGVGSAKLHSMTPVAPLLRMDREDGRFVEGRAVVDGVGEGDNLAAMDWEDFEHLIRELFEKEFARAGGEVRVTRASRDGGVDAVIFDPDPLRGGKIVVQAKRYTNTVGVSAVRDLFGTVVNEGANKGILVSTSDYGPDAYAFAKGKPLVLLNGGELLHLLVQHGHRARIDLAEAKRLLSET